MRRADFCRAEQTRRRRVAQSSKLSQDDLESEGDVPGYPWEGDIPRPKGVGRGSPTSGTVCASTGWKKGADRARAVPYRDSPSTGGCGIRVPVHWLHITVAAERTKGMAAWSGERHGDGDGDHRH